MEVLPCRRDAVQHQRSTPPPHRSNRCKSATVHAARHRVSGIVTFSLVDCTVPRMRRMASCSCVIGMPRSSRSIWRSVSVCRHLGLAHIVAISPEEMLRAQDGAQRVWAMGCRGAGDVTDHGVAQRLRQRGQGHRGLSALDVDRGATGLPRVRAVGGGSTVSSHLSLLAPPGLSPLRFSAVAQVDAPVDRRRAPGIGNLVCAPTTRLGFIARSCALASEPRLECQLYGR